MDFSLLSHWSFVDPKMEMGENNKPPAMRQCRQLKSIC